MGDFFKRLDEIMTGNLVRRVGGLICLLAVVVIGLGFLVGAKSVLKNMKGPDVAVEATTDEAAAEDAEATSEDAEEDYEDEDDYDE